MKYKTVEIPRPEWCEIGTVVRIKDKEGAFTFLGGTDKYAILKEENGLFEVLLEDLTPILAWEPTPGDYCAFWNDGYKSFHVARFNKQDDDFFLSVSAYAWDHVARITGVDCACSVEELKERTDWL